MQATTVEKIIALKLDRLESDDASIHTLLLYRWYFGMLVTYLPRQGKTTIGMLTPLMLTGFAKRLRTDGIAVARDGDLSKRKPRPLCARTVREVLKAVRGLIHLARGLKIIALDPSEGFVLPKGASKEVEVFAAAELHHLFADPIMGDIWKFLSHTALRLEEFCWLTKDDVLTNSEGLPSAIHIRHKRCHVTGKEWWPKHKIERVVPLSEVAATIVAQALAKTTDSWLFQTPSAGGKPAGKWRGARLRAALTRRLKSGGVSHGSPHVFRHTCASYLANAARPMAVPLLQKFLGHRSLESTMRYLHTKNEEVAQSLATADFTALAAAPTKAAPPVLSLVTTPLGNAAASESGKEAKAVQS